MGSLSCDQGICVANCSWKEALIKVSVGHGLCAAASCLRWMPTPRPVGKVDLIAQRCQLYTWTQRPGLMWTYMGGECSCLQCKPSMDLPLLSNGVKGRKPLLSRWQNGRRRGWNLPSWTTDLGPNININGYINLTLMLNREVELIQVKTKARGVVSFSSGLSPWPMWPFLYSSGRPYRMEERVPPPLIIAQQSPPFYMVTLQHSQCLGKKLHKYNLSQCALVAGCSHLPTPFSYGGNSVHSL